jgi:predicted permease
MHVLWFEFMLSLRRLARRKTQNGLMFLTFAVSVTLSLLSWSLFYSVHLRNPDFDPKGEYYVLAHGGQMWVSGNQLTKDEMEAYVASPSRFDDVAELAFYLSTFVKTPTGSERLLGSYPSSQVLRLTGARPLKGTLFTTDDDKYGTPRKVLISERVWINSYASDPAIVGKAIELSGDPATIVGVMPASYRFPNDQDVWMSFGSLPDNDGFNPMRTALVKLKPDITRERAESDLQSILTTLPADATARVRGMRPALIPYREFFLWSDVRVSSLILFALALLFLAVSCANAANLMVIDFLGRRPEIAASLALGIPRGAAIRSVCWQVGMTALGATAVALAVLPVAGPFLFERIKVINGPYWMAYHFSPRDVGMAFILAGISAVVTMIAPIGYLLLVDPEKVIRNQASASRGSGRALWRRMLLTGQVALLTVLGVSAALLVRSNRNVGESRWGFDAARVFSGSVSTLAINYPNGWIGTRLGRLDSYHKVVEEIRRRPETAAVGYVDHPPAYSNGPYCTYATDPAALAGGAGIGEAFYANASQGYFDVLGVPFVAGSDFPEQSPEEGVPYAIINASLANKLWPGQDPMNRAFFVRYPDAAKTDPPMQLVVHGVVRDFQANGPRARSNDAIFMPYLKRRMVWATAIFYLRDRAGVPTFRAVNDAVHRADPRLAVYFPATVRQQIELMLNSVRMTTDLTSIFAAAAVLLCVIGVYSLTVAQVLQSSREFGIRMALGAEPKHLWVHFTRGHLIAALIGVALGLVAASQVVRVLGALLYGVDPYNVPTYVGVALTILVVAGLACIPSLFRLKRINPADCLRSL